MPIYVYEDCCGEGDIELTVPISERDLQYCAYCGEKRKRKIEFTGLTWAPSAGGMR